MTCFAHGILKMGEIRRREGGGKVTTEPFPSCAGNGSQDPMLLAVLEHPKVVNSAYFSPISGRKILTTCIDNRCCCIPFTRCASPQQDIIRHGNL